MTEWNETCSLAPCNHEPITDEQRDAELDGIAEMEIEHLENQCPGLKESIAALEAQLAAANERCAGLAAALEKVNSCPVCENQDHVEDCPECFGTGNWLTEPNMRAILAAVREEAKREGAVEALKQFRNWMWELAVPDEVNTMAEADRRIAALEVKG